MPVYQLVDGSVTETAVKVELEREGRLNAEGYFRLESPLTTFGLIDELMARSKKTKLNPADYAGDLAAQAADNREMVKHKRAVNQFYKLIPWSRIPAVVIFNALDSRFNLEKGVLSFFPFQNQDELPKAVAQAFSKLVSKYGHQELLQQHKNLLEYSDELGS